MISLLQAASSRISRFYAGGTGSDAVLTSIAIEECRATVASSLTKIKGRTCDTFATHAVCAAFDRYLVPAARRYGRRGRVCDEMKMAGGVGEVFTHKCFT